MCVASACLNNRGRRQNLLPFFSGDGEDTGWQIEPPGDRYSQGIAQPETAAAAAGAIKFTYLSFPFWLDGERAGKEHGGGGAGGKERKGKEIKRSSNCNCFLAGWAFFRRQG